VLTIKDRGITKLRGSGRGDLKVGIHVVTPSKLDHKERDLIEQFAARYAAPAPALSQYQQGLFAKLRDRFLG
jgi:molecular chaperone DnaJ